MTSGLPFLGLTLFAALSAAPSSRSERQRHTDLVPLRTPPSRAVYLRPITLDLGSTEEEALLACENGRSREQRLRKPFSDYCDETTFADEVPLRRGQHVPGFWMSRTEVSVAEYARCVAAGRCARAGYEGGAQRFQRDNLPVTLVSFDDARRFCTFRAGRLPTEAEFERAARGAARRAYPWGRSFHGRLANHGRLGVDPADPSDGYAELAPVGSFPGGATPEGILDLAGNAAEWTSDAFLRDDGRPASTERAVRGGHFASAAPFLRGAARTGKPPGAREPTLGFRCVWAVRPLDD